MVLKRAGFFHFVNGYNEPMDQLEAELKIFGLDAIRDSLIVLPEGFNLGRERVDLRNMAQIPALDRITVDPGKCGGKPCIRGMRITVRRVLELLATYRDHDELFREYPFLEDEDIRQALQFAAASVDNEVLELNQVA